MTLLWSPILGRWSDRVGRRPVLLTCILINAAGYALFAHATTLVMLVLSRMLNGIGASNISVAQAYIADTTDSSDRARSLGLIGAAFGLGFIIGPALGGFLKAHGGITAVGYVPCALSLLNALAAWIRLPESAPSTVTLSQPRSLFASIKTVLTLPVRQRLIAFSFLYWFAFVMMQISFVLFCQRTIWLARGCNRWIVCPDWNNRSKHSRGAIGPLVRRYGEKRLLEGGLLLFSTGMLLLPWMPTSALLVLVLTLMAIGSALITPTVNTLLSHTADATLQGAVLGLAQSAASLARILGPVVGMGLYALRHEMPYIVAGLVGLVSMLTLVIPLPALPRPISR